MVQNNFAPEFRIFRICLALTLMGALVFMTFVWKFIPPENLFWMYLILIGTGGYCLLLLRMIKPPDHRIGAVALILFLVIVDSIALLLHPANLMFFSFLLVFTFIAVYNIICVSWPEVLLMDILLFAGMLTFIFYPPTGFRSSIGLLGWDESFILTIVIIYFSLLLILGTAIVEIKKLAERRLWDININLNRAVEEKISEIHRADRKAERYQEQLEVILCHIPVGVVIFDQELNILYTNGVHFKFELMAGQVCESSPGLLPLKIMREYFLEAKARAVLEGRENLIGQRLEYTAPDGSRKIIRYTLVAVRFDQEEVPIIRLVLITEDTTKEEILRQKLIYSDHMAALGKMAASLAHEVNNPLTGIKLHLELMQQNRENAENQRSFYRVVGDNLTRIDRIIKKFLSFSRHEKPKRELTDIRGVLNNTLELAGNFKTFSHVFVTTEFSEELPLILVDKHRLAQVFVNLLNNANDAMAGQGGKLSITCQQQDREIVIRFQDTGEGIKQEELNKIFEPFYTTKEMGHGTGLGLSISYGIIKEHGGSMAVESCEGQGSTFIVRLPIITSEQET